MLLTAPQFTDETIAREYLEALRWPEGPVCPHCGTIGTAYTTKKTGIYRCAEKPCRKDFSVTVKTVFERSKIPLTKWLAAVYLLCASKKGMSSHQMHRMLGVTYKTAWFMTHRIREAMSAGGIFGGPLGGEGKIVEADETFFGREPGAKKRNAYHHKMKLLSLVERGGDVRTFHVTGITHKTLGPILADQISKETALMTDEAGVYKKLGVGFASHGTTNHRSGEYVRGTIHTNTVESFFNILKRGLIGTYHHVSYQHLRRYTAEFDFRYNQRTVTDAERADTALKRIVGKRLTYRRPNETAA